MVVNLMASAVRVVEFNILGAVHLDIRAIRIAPRIGGIAEQNPLGCIDSPILASP